MDEVQEPTPPSSRRWVVILVAAAVLLVGAVFGGRVLREWLRPAPPPAAVENEPTPAPKPALPPTLPPAAAEPAPVAPASARSPRPAKKGPAPPPEPAAPTTGTLKIEADVEGALAFVDRQFVGKVPVTVENVAPGPHQINVSATGFDSHAEQVDVVPGPRDIIVRFREVRLDASVDVVHKHGVGSCQGRLIADLDGVRYETSNKDHTMSVGLADIETIEVNYLDKNLKLKVRGGKTYNFTDKTANADKLFVFQREVTKARDRLAKGDPPAKR